MKALVIPAIGETHEIDIPEGYPGHLDGLQGAVGGWIEYVPTQQNVTLYCNEEGKIEGLPPNPVATRAFGQLLIPHDYLAGDVVIIGAHDAEGNDTSLDVEAWLSYIEEFTPGAKTP
jgi:hypothetical protein